MISRVICYIAITILVGAPASAQPVANGARWTTLGTNSGPIPRADRSEPANLLRYAGEAFLIDAGDGASVQLAKAGVPLTDLHTVILSHLHFDHCGGLFAVISERYQMVAPGVLTIYGPPGTKAMVDGLLAAMRPSPAAGARAATSPDRTVAVVEIVDGARFRIGALAVTAAANSHYASTPGPDHVSLAYRFDLPGRSIAYTGDTGPSAAVERLAKGVDLLVSEVIDPDYALAEIRRTRPDASANVLAVVRRHYELEHLTPENAGRLAARAGARALVLTHDSVDPALAERLRPRVAATYSGQINFARDLDAF